MSIARNWPGHFQCIWLLLYKTHFHLTHKHIDVVWIDWMLIAIESNFDNDVTTIFVNRYISVVRLSLVYQWIYYFISWIWIFIDQSSVGRKRNGHWPLNFSLCYSYVCFCHFNEHFIRWNAICHFFYIAHWIDCCHLYHLKRTFLSSSFLSELDDNKIFVEQTFERTTIASHQKMDF